MGIFPQKPAGAYWGLGRINGVFKENPELYRVIFLELPP